ncbi:hypothetical protein, partial [Mycoplasmopsis gallinarum]|uniref:hypothetical protein n=1 Tax=Mycoplasmopsis gallinarum TaxID=29557 RepID=UPI000A7C06D9
IDYIVNHLTKHFSFPKYVDRVIFKTYLKEQLLDFWFNEDSFKTRWKNLNEKIFNYAIFDFNSKCLPKKDYLVAFKNIKDYLELNTKCPYQANTIYFNDDVYVWDGIITKEW